MLENGADINKIDVDGETPLFKAFNYTHIETAKFFIGAMLEQKPEQEKPNYIWQNKVLSAHWNECIETVALKKIILNKKTSLFDFYSIKNENKLASLSCNEKLQNMLNKDEFIEKYPLFGQKIKENFERGLARNRALNTSLNSIHFNNKNDKLPAEV